MRKVYLIIAIVLCTTLPMSAFGHSGRTDGSGGHKDNQNASGLGPYHYHHGEGPHLHPGGTCSLSAPAPPVQTQPSQPVQPSQPAQKSPTPKPKAVAPAKPKKPKVKIDKSTLAKGNLAIHDITGAISSITTVLQSVS